MVYNWQTCTRGYGEEQKKKYHSRLTHSATVQGEVVDLYPYTSFYEHDGVPQTVKKFLQHNFASKKKFEEEYNLH